MHKAWSRNSKTSYRFSYLDYNSPPKKRSHGITRYLEVCTFQAVSPRRDAQEFARLSGVGRCHSALMYYGLLRKFRRTSIFFSLPTLLPIFRCRARSKPILLVVSILGPERTGTTNVLAFLPRTSCCRMTQGSAPQNSVVKFD